ncbi:mitochondrial carrier domain-containing protein [Phycomyces nitens]|nr:mitochondrial carrier domain-containing protein [Phycomyces nitens]
MKKVHETLILLEDYKLPPLGHAISGAVGSSIANLFVYPLDIATTRIQLNSKQTDKTKKQGLLETIINIYKSEGGIKGLYAGLGSDTVASVLSSFIYFYCYTALRNIQEKLNTKMGKATQLNVAQELFLGAEAALISRLFTTPVSNVTTRLQTAGHQSKKGFVDMMKDIYEEKGITGFWTGYRASIMLVSNPSITYFVFEKVKSLYLRNSKNSLSSFQIFLLSAISKSIATAITYPFIFVRTKMVADVKGKNNVENQKSIMAIFKDTFEKEGASGIYKGIRAQIIKGFFNQGIMYMIKDYVATYLTLVFYASLKLKFRRQQASLL